jgi:hypothetical protein
MTLTITLSFLHRLPGLLGRLKDRDKPRRSEDSQGNESSSSGSGWLSRGTSSAAAEPGGGKSGQGGGKTAPRAVGEVSDAAIKLFNKVYLRSYVNVPTYTCVGLRASTF